MCDQKIVYDNCFAIFFVIIWTKSSFISLDYFDYTNGIKNPDIESNPYLTSVYAIDY
jgi:hypothetical protein